MFRDSVGATRGEKPHVVTAGATHLGGLASLQFRRNGERRRSRLDDVFDAYRHRRQPIDTSDACASKRPPRTASSAMSATIFGATSSGSGRCDKSTPGSAS